MDSAAQSYKIVNDSSPNGIYVYDHEKRLWQLVRVDGEHFKPGKKGVYVIYFDNTKCSACRKYDNIWFPFIESLSNSRKDINFVIVLCNWFARDCNSSAAANTFKHYDVHASPTTVVLYANDNGDIVYQEKYEGVLYEFELKLILENFEERAQKAAKGEKVTPPIEKKSGSVIEDLVLAILRSILEKKDVEEKK